jgi:hypothetical protein
MKDTSEAQPVLGNVLRTEVTELLVPGGSPWIVESVRRGDGNHTMV